MFYNLNCKTLDVSDRFGDTNYIDFIKQSEVTENIMKGSLASL